ncbi:MAG: hypothetical protein IKO39_06905 [Treponema sp.]|nr:hypothetical protein [Treponema sp.]
MKKNANKILLSVAAIICAGMGVITGLSVYNSVKFNTLSKKMENLAAEKFISLQGEGDDLRSRNFKNDFVARDELSERIRDELSFKGWKLESKDSIECDAPKIIYKGNVEGTYTLNGENAEQYCYRSEKYSLPETNNDGSRKREYTPKTAEELEQVRLTVVNAINNVLEGKVSPVRFRKSGRFTKNENENLDKNKESEYTDIQVTITSEPDFDKFIPQDYRFYKNGFDENRSNALFYTLILCFYIICFLSYFLSYKTKKSFMVKRIFAIVALAGICVFVKFDFNKIFPIFLQFLVIVIILDWALKILTKNNFSRRTFFNFLGTITAFLWLYVPFAHNGYFFSRFNENQTDFIVVVFIFLSSVITFCMLAQSWRVILDERPQ